MKKGDVVYHKVHGLMEVKRNKYQRLGNKNVFFGTDESGKEHEIDDSVESPEKYLKEKEKKESPKMMESMAELLSSIQGPQGEKGLDSDEESIIEKVLERIELPKDGKDGADADIELVARELLPNVLEKMPKPEKVNESSIVEKLMMRIKIPQDGKVGEKGKDGSPDTPKEIKGKLETLTGDERLDASAIKNLPKPIIGGGQSYTGLVKVDSTGTPGTLEDKLIAGSNITLTKTNDTIRIASSGGVGGGSVDSVVAGNNIDVDATDPANPIVSATIEPYYIYVAANDATTREKAIADYLCDGTADQVQINLAIDDVRATGGKVILSSGNFAIAASIDLTGDVAEDDGNPAITLIGSGIEGTVLTGGSNIDVITTGQRAKFELAYMTIKASGSGDCLSQTAGTERGNWQSFVHDLYLQGNFSDHSGWGINMESPFRMRFANIEMNGVANGVNLKCHTESFNPGNLSLDRVFIDLWNDASNASAVGLRLAVTSSSSTGVMNLVSVNRLDIAGGSNLTSSIGIEIVGASASYGDSRHHTFNSLNIEDVKTAIKFTRGRDCTFTDLNYVRVLGSGKIIELDSASHNNSFENLYAVGTTSTTFDLITDANSSSALPNRLTRVDGYQPASVTINATLATNTILEHVDLSGGSPTIDSDITTRNNRRTFADVLVDDDAYDATNWNGNLEVPTKNAIRDKIETLGGGGNVSKVGTPADNQVGVWTGDGTIEGDADLMFDTSTNKLSTGALLLSGLTASEMVITDGSRNIVSAAVATYPSLTELAYIKGLTSSAQTQLTARLPLAGGTMTGNITLGENTSIALDPAGSADGKYSGITVAGTAGATLAFGDLIYLDPTDSRWELADANAAAAADGDARGLLGICVLAAASDGSATTVLLQGIVRADTAFPAMTIGAPLYVSETAGDVVVAQPTTTDVVIRIVGVAMTADEMFFRPDFTWVTHT